MRRIFALLILSPFVISCAEIQKLSKEYTQRDPVTGQPVLNKYSIEWEIEQGRILEPEFIKDQRAKGFAVDNDPGAMARIQRVFRSITQVCHLPKLPWRVHYSTNPEWNAFATYGGLVFVFKGLLDDLDDIGLAAVIGHEIAHVTCRHVTERKSNEEVVGGVNPKALSEYYRASFSTENEGESDKVGLLYMALAGYDPRNAYQVWERMHARYGSNPGNFKYTHPLNNMRAAALRRDGPIAAKYYAGPGRINPNYGAILANNELVPRNNSPADPNTDWLAVGLTEYAKNMQMEREAKARQQAATFEQQRQQADAQRKQAALKFVTVNNVQFGNTTDGKQGVFADITNGSNVMMKTIVITFYYFGDNNAVLHQESIAVRNLFSGHKTTAGAYLRPIPGYKKVGATATDVDY